MPSMLYLVLKFVDGFVVGKEKEGEKHRSKDKPKILSSIIPSFQVNLGHV